MSTTLQLVGGKTIIIGIKGVKLYGKPMRLTMNIVNGDKVDLPLNHYKNIIIDWGDNNIVVSEPGVWENTLITHTYASTNVFNIYIYVYDFFSVLNHRKSKGKIPQYGSNNGIYSGIFNITSVKLGKLRCTSYCNAFISATNLTTITGKIEKHTQDLSGMFEGCSSLVSTPTLHQWDVSNVRTMITMFWGCSNFNSTHGLSSWNVSKVEDMSYMFSDCTLFTSDLSKWDVSKVKYMSVMFQGCSNFTSDLSKWDISNVIELYYMFQGCIKFTSDLSSWNISNVKFLSNMFQGCTKFNSDISKWNFSNIIDMTDMLTETAFSVKNYNKLLKSLCEHQVRYNVALGTLTISPSPKYLKYRNHLVHYYNWTIV
jgi:surface protein